MIRNSTRTLSLVAALAVLALGLAPLNVVRAQDVMAPAKLGGTVWAGSETLNGFGDLVFGFRPDGTAFMCDARSDPNDAKTYVRGTWSRNGTRVTIRFDDCVYQGRLNGTALAGTGRLNNGQTWTFQVRYQPPQQNRFGGPN
jgi:hypothetical protein